jgi:hypothetical protein
VASSLLEIGHTSVNSLTVAFNCMYVNVLFLTSLSNSGRQVSGTHVVGTDEIRRHIKNCGPTLFPRVLMSAETCDYGPFIQSLVVEARNVHEPTT